jgi:hypothetical protein
MRARMAPTPNPSNPAFLALKLSWRRLYRASDLTIVKKQEDRACINTFPSMRRSQAWHTRVWSLVAKMRVTLDLRASAVQHREDEPQASNDPIGSLPRSDTTVNRQELCTACRHAVQEGV